MTSPYNRRLAGTGGFTLIELVAVLAIMALAAGMVAVSVGRSYDSSLIRQEAARLYTALRHARELSLMDRVPVRFRIAADGGSYWIERPEARVGNVLSLPAGMALSGPEIIFMPKGSSTGGLVSLTDGKGRTYAVQVDPVTGKAQAERL